MNRKSFKKIVIPWYDSDKLCFCIIGVMALVIYFSIVGIYTAKTNPAYQEFAWVPYFLLFIGIILIISIIYRLIKRNFMVKKAKRESSSLLSR
jgi:hypothetical protein